MLTLIQAEVSHRYIKKHIWTPIFDHKSD